MLLQFGNSICRACFSVLLLDDKTVLRIRPRNSSEPEQGLHVCYLFMCLRALPVFGFCTNALRLLVKSPWLLTLILQYQPDISNRWSSRNDSNVEIISWHWLRTVLGHGKLCSAKCLMNSPQCPCWRKPTTTVFDSRGGCFQDDVKNFKEGKYFYKARFFCTLNYFETFLRWALSNDKSRLNLDVSLTGWSSACSKSTAQQLSEQFENIFKGSVTLI